MHLGQAGVVRVAGLEGAKVCRVAGDEQAGADGAVRRFDHAAKRSGESVDGAQLGVREGDASTEASGAEVGLRLSIQLFATSSADRSGGEAEAFPSDAVGDRVGIFGKVGFEALDEGVHASVGSDFGGKLVGELRIDDGPGRQHGSGAKAYFNPCFRDADDAIASDFRASAGGRGDRHERKGVFSKRLALAHAFEEVDELAWVGGEGGDRFAGIDDAAAADSDDAFSVRVARGLGREIDGIEVWLALYRVDEDFEARL